MQVRRWLTPLALSGGVLALSAPRGAAAVTMDESTVTSMLRLFTDSDHVAVRSYTGDWSTPVRGDGALALHWNNEHVTIPAIKAPVGSTEAVDAITTASRPIAGNAYTDFIKVRNEMQGEYSRGPAAVNYYLSTESDYLAQQLGATLNRDFNDQRLNLAFGTSLGRDDIKPLADDDTRTAAATKTTVHLDAVATQVLSPTTMLRYGVEYNVVEGLQHNPYRNVYAGGTHVAERHPDHRQRRDTFFKLNQYLPNRSSLKLQYRLYNDDWGITSHEIGTHLSQYVTESMSARWEYRWYTQTRATFYRPEYETVDGVNGYRSGDYRMNELASHLFGVSLHLDMDALAAAHPVLGRMALWLNYERYFNSNNYSANILETGLDFRFR